MHSLFDRYARKSMGAVFSALLVLAGCHHNNLNSGAGYAWVTLSDTPGDYTSYTVNVDSVSLTGATVGSITAVSTVETVDFTKLDNVSELWSAATLPNDTYSSAQIILDYTSANISVMVNGLPTKAKVVDTTGAAVTTQTISVTFDKDHPLVIQPTTTSSSAQRLAIDFNLAASNVVNLATSPPTVTIKPFLTAATSAADTKPVRVRGPLVNSSLGEGTYSVYIRPFFDEVNTLGQLTIFNSPNTVYTINGTTYIGAAGLNVMSQLSAGTTMSEAITTYQPTLTPLVTAAKFNSTFVIAGSTLEDYYTQGLEGDVIARNGNTLTLRGSTLQLNDGTSSYNNDYATVLLGPSTIVTAEDNTTLTGLDYNSVSVGQHIIARGIYTLPSSGIVNLDATGASSTNTGSVRLQSTQVWGSLVSTASTSLVMDLQTIENWPYDTFELGNNGGTVPASFMVDTAEAKLPDGLTVGGPVSIDGIFGKFKSVPPDFIAFQINSELSVPAYLRVDWTSVGTTAPFSTLTTDGLTINLANTDYSSGVIRIGSETIDLKSLAATPHIIPHPAAAPTAPTLPDVFLPQYAIGNLSAADTTSIAVYNNFDDFVAELPKALVAATPALHLVAAGLYNRGNNTFTATSIDVVN